MARRRPPEPRSTDDSPGPELLGRAQIEDWLSPADMVAAHEPVRGQQVTGGNLPWLRMAAAAHRLQREARREWVAERGLQGSKLEWEPGLPARKK